MSLDPAFSRRAGRALASPYVGRRGIAWRERLELALAAAERWSDLPERWQREVERAEGAMAQAVPLDRGAS